MPYIARVWQIDLKKEFVLLLNNIYFIYLRDAFKRKKWQVEKDLEIAIPERSQQVWEELGRNSENY